LTLADRRTTLLWRAIRVARSGKLGRGSRVTLVGQ
jgi:hypothetical protein